MIEIADLPTDTAVTRVDAHRRTDHVGDVTGPAELARDRPVLTGEQRAQRARIVLQLPRRLQHRFIALQKLRELGVGARELALREVDVRIQNPDLVLVDVVAAESLELTDQRVSARVVFRFVAGRGRFVQRLGQALGVTGNQVIVVARVVEAVGLVRDPTQGEPRQISDLEELAPAEERGEPRRLVRVRDAAEQPLALAEASLVDLDQTGAIGGLRPEAARWRHRRVGGEGLPGLVCALVRGCPSGKRCHPTRAHPRRAASSRARS